MLIRTNYIDPDTFAKDEPHSDSGKDDLSPVVTKDDDVCY